MPYSRKEETLLHEIMEMLLYYGDGFDQDNSFNHAAFQKYVSMLYAILKQNNLLVQSNDSPSAQSAKRKATYLT